jgi:excisionase family DNA binding protein
MTHPTTKPHLTTPPHPLGKTQPSPLAKPQILPPQLLRLEEVGGYLKLSKRSVYRLLEDGRLKAVRVGAWRRVRLDDLIEYVEARSS